MRYRLVSVRNLRVSVHIFSLSEAFSQCSFQLLVFLLSCDMVQSNFHNSKEFVRLYCLFVCFWSFSFVNNLISFSLWMFSGHLIYSFNTKCFFCFREIAIFTLAGRLHSLRINKESEALYVFASTGITIMSTTQNGM